MEKEIKIGKKYNILAYPNTGSLIVETATVRDIFTINGEKIVRYSLYTFPFRIYYHTSMKEFIEQVEL